MEREVTWGSHAQPPTPIGPNSRLPGSTIELVPKATSTKPGSSSPGTRNAGSTERKAAKVVESARAEADRVRREAKADAGRIQEEAEEHARRLVLDARATADGVRAEGMEVVSNLRQISDTLREMADRVLEDVEAIHARMVGRLDAVDAAAAHAPGTQAPAEAHDELELPDFVSRD
jgi:cell division septum initiation protein DivIVA